MTASIAVPDPFPPGVAPPWTHSGHRDPAPWFATMAAERPVSFDERSGIWHFCGYGAVQAFLRAHDVWSTAKRLEQVPPDHRVVRLLTSEPPEHVELRGRVRDAYRPKRIAALEARIRTVAAELVDACLQKERFDVIADLAVPLTATMIGELLGVPRDVNDELMATSTVMLQGGALGHVAADDAEPVLYMGGQPPEDNVRLQETFTSLIQERRQDPRDDLISNLAVLPPEDFEQRLDVGALLFEQLGAGQNTTTHLLGSMIYLLDRFPEQQRRLRDRPDLAAGAIEESVRHIAPLQARPRISTRDVEVNGVTIPEGATGLAWLQAANFDCRMFPDPTRFDISRSPNHHLSFGFGEHYCLGASLARREARVVLDELLARTSWITRADSAGPEWHEDFILRGPRSVEVEVVPR